MDGVDGRRIIRTTPMWARYRAMTNETTAARVLEARRVLESPARYAEAVALDFEDSVRLFETYDNREEGFYDKRSSRQPVAGQATTFDFVAALDDAGVSVVPIDAEARLTMNSTALIDVPAEALSFRYVDRELLIHRTTGRAAQWDTGRANRGGIRIDLLLATTEAAPVPIVAELKIGADRDPLYALIQGLAGIAHLATPNQYERIRQRVDGAGGFPSVPHPRFDLYVIANQPPPLDDSRRLLRDAALALAQDLLVNEAVTRSVRRIAMLDLRFGDDAEPVATVGFAAQGA